MKRYFIFSDFPITVYRGEPSEGIYLSTFQIDGFILEDHNLTDLLANLIDAESALETDEAGYELFKKTIAEKYETKTGRKEVHNYGVDLDMKLVNLFKCHQSISDDA